MVEEFGVEISKAESQLDWEVIECFRYIIKNMI